MNTPLAMSITKLLNSVDTYLELNNNELPTFEECCNKIDDKLRLEENEYRLMNGEIGIKSLTKDFSDEEKENMWQRELKFIKAMYGEDDRKYNPNSTYRRRKTKEHRRRLANNHMLPSYNKRSNHRERGIIKGRPGGSDPIYIKYPRVNKYNKNDMINNPNRLDYGEWLASASGDEDPKYLPGHELEFSGDSQDKTYKQALVDDDKFRRSVSSEHAYVINSQGLVEDDSGDGDRAFQTCRVCKQYWENCESVRLTDWWCVIKPGNCHECKQPRDLCYGMIANGFWCKRTNTNQRRNREPKYLNTVSEPTMKTHLGETKRNNSKIGMLTTNSSEKSTILVSDSYGHTLDPKNANEFIEDYYGKTNKTWPVMEHKQRCRESMEKSKIKKNNAPKTDLGSGILISEESKEKIDDDLASRIYKIHKNLRPTYKRSKIINMNERLFSSPIKIKIPLVGMEAEMLFEGINKLGKDLSKVQVGKGVLDTIVTLPSSALTMVGALGTSIAKGAKYLREHGDMDPSFNITYSFVKFYCDTNELDNVITDTSDDIINRGDASHLDALLAYYNVIVEPTKPLLDNNFHEEFSVLVSLELFFHCKNTNICNPMLTNSQVRDKIGSFVNTNTRVRWSRYITNPIQNDTSMFVYAYHLGNNAKYSRTLFESDFPKNDMIDDDNSEDIHDVDTEEDNLIINSLSVSDEMKKFQLVDNINTTDKEFEEMGLNCDDVKVWKSYWNNSPDVKVQHSFNPDKIITVGYGYAFGEVKLPEIKPIKNIQITPRIPSGITSKKPMIVHSGFGTHYAYPHADTEDYKTTICGVLKRMACKPPTPIPGIIRRLKEFNERLIRKYLLPLEPTTDLSFETWLSLTRYSEARKEQLRMAYNLFLSEVPTKRRNYKLVSSFVKLEQYPEYKHPRLINARSDMFKAVFGPIVKAIENIVFKLPNFIKKIPNSERPEYIKNIFESTDIFAFIEGDDALVKAFGRIFGTDFTAFESHFTKEMMEALEFPLYEYMISGLPNKDYYQDLFDTLKGINRIQNKHYELFIEATRMSGEMNTSLGNGWSNFVIIMFLLEEHGENLNSKHYEDLGFTVKLDEFENLGEASFCGMVFDERAMDIIVNPMTAINNFSWNSNKYMMAGDKLKRQLLKCKALSYAHMYPRCPIIRRMCDKVLSLIPEEVNVESDWFNSTYLYERYLTNVQGDLPSNIVKHDSRMLMEKKFGITIHDQILAERDINEISELGTFELPSLEKYWGKDVVDYTNTYVHNVKAALVLNPGVQFPRKAEFNFVSRDPNVVKILLATERVTIG